MIHFMSASPHVWALIPNKLSYKTTWHRQAVGSVFDDLWKILQTGTRETATAIATEKLTNSCAPPGTSGGQRTAP